LRIFIHLYHLYAAFYQFECLKAATVFCYFMFSLRYYLCAKIRSFRCCIKSSPMGHSITYKYYNVTLLPELSSDAKGVSCIKTYESDQVSPTNCSLRWPMSLCSFFSLAKSRRERHHARSDTSQCGMTAEVSRVVPHRANESS
jgi:hypothetical protein